MNLEQLAGFAEVARTGHFTRAAERLHLAQPSLSRQIATLEQELGVDLFHRARGNVTLTAAGERLLPLAKRMLADAATARSEMAELAGLKRGRVRLGATPTLCTSLVTEVLVEFQARHPGIDIEMLERGSRSLIEALVEGSLDLAIIVTSVSSGTARAVIEREPVLSERLVVVSSAVREDPFGGGPVGLAELAGVPQVLFPKNYDLRAAVDLAFRERGLEPRIAVEGVEMDAALRFAERGIGVAVVPAMVTVGRPLLRVTPLADERLTRTVSVARRTDMTPTHSGSAMRALIREVAERFTGPGATAEHLVSPAR
ncbi:LysR family transcriptional regulator [Gulosibacter sp. 10]|uniref:LysR family transcriptional regulator n=1 Tax=Gulosibacter sp. 10 TaxID=1255570 RepID=UPI00097F0348|nr:LysR family transcriptional regulator [Gulosibacter sp. 10]SJM70733.1 putative lysR-family transcriptional regulator [Gulosibacter sp. 10]